MFLRTRRLARTRQVLNVMLELGGREQLCEASLCDEHSLRQERGCVLFCLVLFCLPFLLRKAQFLSGPRRPLPSPWAVAGTLLVGDDCEALKVKESLPWCQGKQMKVVPAERLPGLHCTCLVP